MAGNRLSSLPSEVGQLPLLKRLGLKGNALVKLPASLGDLSHLVELYLTKNNLEALPDEVRLACQLVNDLPRIVEVWSFLRGGGYVLVSSKTLYHCQLNKKSNPLIIPPFQFAFVYACQHC